MEPNLKDRRCIPCRQGTPPLEAAAADELLAQLQGWEIVDRHHLAKEYAFSDFTAALDFVNRVGAVAEREAHHPDVFLSWGRARIQVWTHAAGGLTDNDFIFAAKADEVL